MRGTWSIRHARREQEKLEKGRLRGNGEYIKAGQKDREWSVRRAPDTSQRCQVTEQDGHKQKSSKFYIKQEMVKKLQG